MVGFTDLSDTDESLIDEIISQAQDSCILDQLSALNCASFTDSSLPTHLESRFRNLKSFPPTKPNRTNTAPPPPHHSKAQNFSPSKETPHEKTCLDPKLQSGYVSSPSNSLDSSPVKANSPGENGLKAKSRHGSGSGSSHVSEESSMSSLFKPNQDKEKCLKQNPKSGSLCSPRSTSNSYMGSPSPPRKAGCFWCSPKKDSPKKKIKENWGVGNVVGWDKSDELLSDLGSFASKKQQKMLKKAMKEEQKISREAEKIVEWAKQASARMNVLDIEDELSDH